jgi:hypothetical protein
LCGKNAGLIHVKAGGKHNNHWALKIRPNWKRSVRPMSHTLGLYFHPNSNSEAFSQQRNILTERPPPVGEFLVPTFVDRGVWRGQRGGSPTVVNLSFIDRSRYFFFQIAPHLSSQELSGPRSRPTATQKTW